MTRDEVRTLLQDLGFPARWITEQTVFCILALADTAPRQGLLPGYTCLADGARIHDILTFVREDIGHPVAENTRESYRKSSLRPLMEAGWVIRHQLSTNDPNTYYRLRPDFARLCSSPPAPERDKLVEGLRLPEQRRPKPAQDVHEDVPVRIAPEQIHTLSPGLHNLLEKAVVETLGPALLRRTEVVYLGDTAPRVGYQNRALMRQLNLPIDVSVALPDVILYSPQEPVLLVAEVVVSSGPITPARLAQLQKLTANTVTLGIQVLYISAFPSRRILRRFVEDIVWGSSVWIEREPHNIIHFALCPRSAGEG
ncbi:MAG: hypothetical protein FJ026_07105 [Chloroflexi bacterium]|nr:hypothetical protein [Chloroflexota bacterium]